MAHTFSVATLWRRLHSRFKEFIELDHQLSPVRLAVAKSVKVPEYVYAWSIRCSPRFKFLNRATSWMWTGIQRRLKVHVDSNQYSLAWIEWMYQASNCAFHKSCMAFSYSDHLRVTLNRVSVEEIIKCKVLFLWPRLRHRTDIRQAAACK